ncbi:MULTISPECIES: guanine deaminase [unclassified Mesorhizobium]|jgi:guanine deaminase|uniref:guanine deaminase n=1 Tax=unclassified Mesorhizobium TaxID=325217 RepID=UPI000FE33828|nr:MULTISPECIES: guanine deaminase [unclassified Mesorhizobium]MDG4894395.1 guanine deaminase [Mesorhizobium sp. WSM4976]RWH68744.1 MAG: guanine deaminase [Mesorhizobium sp.]RWL24438.1 MAG: guanine deaminase [Mesorhizobium sp.]RWL26313.1 MAG: guanine deaminase [Mesorhizobium sp.]RWL35594.1 MAG: guanine deaminase [Mesorhizobium sp.]
MTSKLLRGRTLSFLRWPETVDDHSAWRYEEDGALLIENGKIVAAGSYAEVLKKAGASVETIDHRPHLILPGFVDAHVHVPQMQVIASYGAELLDWLNKYTFPEESKFQNAQHGRRIARLFLDEMLRHGTTTVAAYCSVHKSSAEAFFAESHERNMLNIAGKVMMDRNAPDGVRDTPRSGYDDTKALIAEWHGKGRQLYAITPRFAITSSPEQMEMAGALCREHPDLHMQTHLSENHAEIAFTQELYPWSRDYTDVYEHYGLLGRKSLFGHCIHLSEHEANALSQSGSVAVFCPTSNLFLGSGLFDYQRYRRRENPLRIAAATDVGGGTNYSMLRTMDEGYKVIALNGEKLNPFQSFWQLTRGNAEALSVADKVGTLDEGTDADTVVLDARSTPGMRLRMETVETLAEELFLLQTLGDDRAVREVYVAGRPAKSAIVA